MTPSDIETLQAKIAKSHSVFLNKDDPIFLAVHLNELILAKMLADLRTLSSEARNESIAAVAHQVDVAKVAAAKLINETAHFVAGEAKTQIKMAIDASLMAAHQSARLSQQASTIALGAAAVVLATAGAVAGVFIAVLLRR